MVRIKQFVKTSFIGGILVILPIAILVTCFNWLFIFVTDLIQPITDFVIANRNVPEVIADLIVVTVIALSCFFIGTIARTSFGRWLHNHFDKQLSALAPGYKLIKEVVGQFLGDKSNSPFTNGDVARAKIFGPDCPTSVTAIVTSKHQDGSFTVFVPTGPNPTSGNMFHLQADQVEMVEDAKVEEMMRTIIACGAGSDVLFSKAK